MMVWTTMPGPNCGKSSELTSDRRCAGQGREAPQGVGVSVAQPHSDLGREKMQVMNCVERESSRTPRLGRRCLSSSQGGLCVFRKLPSALCRLSMTHWSAVSKRSGAHGRGEEGTGCRDGRGGTSSRSSFLSEYAPNHYKNTLCCLNKPLDVPWCAHLRATWTQRRSTPRTSHVVRIRMVRVHGSENQGTARTGSNDPNQNRDSSRLHTNLIRNVG